MAKLFTLAALALTVCSMTTAAELSSVDNFQQLSGLLSSSSQPSHSQLKDAALEGYQRVIYLAFTDNNTAIEHEDRTVKELGMDYVHIPVDFHRPTIDDFDNFVRVMDRSEPVKTLVHCQVNLRASSFSFLYRVIHLDIPIADAKRELDKAWFPNETWFRFIRSTLEQHGLTHTCEECDWGEHEFLEPTAAR